MDDLISRQELIEAMYHEAMEADSEEQRWDGGCWIRYKMFERVLGSLPSAQERKKGRWVRIEDENGDFLCWECSECRERYVMPYHRASYCPNCGAEMENSDE